jgi:polyhydroxyalkanoate synthase
MIDPVTAALAGLDALAPVGRPDLAAAVRRAAGTALPLAPALRLAADLARRPLAAAGRGTDLAVELLGIGLGPGGPVRERLARARLATRAAADDLLDGAALGPADRERLHTALDAVDGVVGAAVGAVQGVVGGAAREPVAPGRRPVVGEELAASPGAVVLRTPVFELVQYLPRTESVRAVPLLVVPPLAGRHYLADLTPGTSLVERLVAAGQQVLALSWRNPGPGGHSDTDEQDFDDQGLDDRIGSVLDALDATERITRSPATALLAIGSSATVATALVGHLAAIGSADRVASLTLAVSVPGPPRPPESGLPTALLAWAADGVRVPARLRAELVDLADRDALAHPGEVRVLGTPVDLGKIDCPAYAVAGDRARWRTAYRAAGRLGGERRFVLADGSPVAAFLGGTGSYLVGPVDDPDADRWSATAPLETGSWWTDHLGWLAARSGPEVDAPPELGGRGLHPLAPTPGAYALSP